MAHSPQTAPAPSSIAAPSPLARLVDRVWWFFTSVRVALWMIGATVAWVLVATLAQSTFPVWVAQQVPALSGLMNKWSNWEVWLSPPFLITLGLLAVSIVLGGMVNRWSGIAQRVWRPNVRTSPGFFNAVKQHDEAAAPSVPAGLAAFERAVTKKRYRLLSHTDARSGSVHLYADKHRYSPLATFPFHLGLVLIMVGAVWIASAGWREIGFFVPDGSTRPVGHGTGLTVTNNGFVDDYYDDGRAKDYYSDLDVRDATGKVVASGRLRVNSPINVGAVSLHQATFGNAAKLKITDPAGHVVFDDGVPLLDPSARAQALGVTRPIGVQRLDDLGVTVRVSSAGSGAPDDSLGAGQVAVAVFDNRAAKASAGPLGTAVLDPGAAATISGLTITFAREVRFTGLQITYAPGLPLIYLAAALIFFSILVTFYLPQRRLRALVTPLPDGAARLRLGAQVKLDLGGAREFTEIAAGVKAALHAADDAQSAHVPAAPETMETARAEAETADSFAAPVAGD